MISSSICEISDNQYFFIFSFFIQIAGRLSKVGEIRRMIADAAVQTMAQHITQRNTLTWDLGSIIDKEKKNMAMRHTHMKPFNPPSIILYKSHKTLNDNPQLSRFEVLINYHDTSVS